MCMFIDICQRGGTVCINSSPQCGEEDWSLLQWICVCGLVHPSLGRSWTGSGPVVAQGVSFAMIGVQFNIYQAHPMTFAFFVSISLMSLYNPTK